MPPNGIAFFTMQNVSIKPASADEVKRFIENSNNVWNVFLKKDFVTESFFDYEIKANFRLATESDIRPLQLYRADFINLNARKDFEGHANHVSVVLQNFLDRARAGHETGHYVGAEHSEDGSGGIMSYDKERAVILREARNLFREYRKNQSERK